MQVVSVLNMKGGVGKTTMAVNLAYALSSLHDKRVLLVDVDPQFNASTSLMSPEQYIGHLEDDKKKTILDIFRPNAERMNTATVRQGRTSKGSIDLRECTFTVHSQLGGVLDLIPSNLLLMESRFLQSGAENKLKNFLREKTQGYDYVILDCPPTISFFTSASVLASDAYIVPVKPDPLSAIGLPLLERWIEETAGDYSLDLKFVGIVFTMVSARPTNQMREVMRQVTERYPGKAFAATIRNYTVVPSATAANSPILSFKPNVPASDDIRAVAIEFLQRVK